MLYAHALDTHLWWLRNTVDVYNTDTKWIFLHTGTVFTPQEVLKKKKNTVQILSSLDESMEDG